jgi:hypothetical protein
MCLLAILEKQNSKRTFFTNAFPLCIQFNGENKNSELQICKLLTTTNGRSVRTLFLQNKKIFEFQFLSINVLSESERINGG